MGPAQARPDQPVTVSDKPNILFIMANQLRWDYLANAPRPQVMFEASPLHPDGAFQ
jgi:hypothetical protein